MYEHEQIRDIPTDQIYRLPSQLFHNMSVCLFFSDQIAWLFGTALRQAKSNSLQGQVMAELLVVS